MNKKFCITITVFTAMLIFVSCGKPSNDSAISSKDTSRSFTDSRQSEKKISEQADAAVTVKDGKVDLDEIGKTFKYKDHPLDLNLKLSEYPSGWTFKSKYKKQTDDAAVNLFYDEELAFTGMILGKVNDEKLNEYAINNVSIESEDFSIDGFVPNKTKIDDVVKKYGEPNEKLEKDNGETYYYYYENNEDKWDVKLTVGFSDDNTINLISYKNQEVD